MRNDTYQYIFRIFRRQKPHNHKKTPFAHEQTPYSYTNRRFEWSIPTRCISFEKFRIRTTWGPILEFARDSFPSTFPRLSNETPPTAFSKSHRHLTARDFSSEKYEWYLPFDIRISYTRLQG